MNLVHVPVVMHFGPNKTEPTLLTKGNPNDRNALLLFMLEQTQSQLKASNTNLPNSYKIYGFVALSTISLITILGIFGFFKLDLIIKNSILWCALITVSYFSKL